MFKYNYLGNNINILNKILDSDNQFYCNLKKSNYPMVIIGDEVLSHKESKNIQMKCIEILDKLGGFRKDWNGYNILHNTASAVGSLCILNKYTDFNHLDLVNECKEEKIKFVYLLGVDEVNHDYNNSFVVYQGHHGDVGAQKADVILPGSAYTEKSGIYLNLEGRLQISERAVFPPGEAKEDWTIIRALSEYLGKKVNYNNLEELRDALFNEIPIIKPFEQNRSNSKPKFKKVGQLESSKLICNNKKFFMTCPISRSSITMAECLKNV